MAYEYYPSSTPALPWGKIILAGMGFSVIIIVFIFFIWDPMNLIIDKPEDLYMGNQSNNQGNGSQGVAVGEPNPYGYDCTSDVYNCENFTTQREAQVAFDSCFETAGDVWKIDTNSNGKACEGLG